MTSPAAAPQAAFCNSTELAGLCGVSVRTVHRMVKAGVVTPLTKMPGATGAYVFSLPQAERVAAELNAQRAASDAAWRAACERAEDEGR